MRNNVLLVADQVSGQFSIAAGHGLGIRTAQAQKHTLMHNGCEIVMRWWVFLRLDRLPFRGRLSCGVMQRVENLLHHLRLRTLDNLIELPLFRRQDGAGITHAGALSSNMWRECERAMVSLHVRLKEKTGENITPDQTVQDGMPYDAMACNCAVTREMS